MFIEHCACLYLAAKVNEFELVKIRDIINVVHFTMLSPEPTLDQMDDFDMDEQARHKQLLAQVVVGENRITMADYAVIRERILE